MQNAERRMQNDLTTLRSVHKERIKRGTRSAECGTTSLHYVPFTRKILKFIYSVIIFLLFFIHMSVVQRSEDNSAFCILRSAF